MTFSVQPERRILAGMILCYTAVALACLTVRPLWVDEVLQLIVTRNSPTYVSMLDGIRIGAGAVPIGYLTQRPFVSFGEASAFWARFPAAIFSVASCILLIRICRELNLSGFVTALAAGIFMIAPAQFRYAIEGRPYSESLCLALIAVIALCRLARGGGIRTAAAATIAIALGLYTQAYMLFAVAGVALWYSVEAFRRGNRRRMAGPLVCLIFGAALFAPWYLIFSPEWHERMHLSGYPDFHWTRALAFDVFKSISGGGLLCTVALMALVIAGLWATSGAASLLLSAAFAAIVAPVLVDSLQNYFFASRQIFYAIPFLAVLAAMGFDVLLRKNRIGAVSSIVVFAIAALTTDITFQIRSKEDWAAAARALAREVNAQGLCIQPAVELSGAVEMYSVFVPPLLSAVCPPAGTPRKVAFVSNLKMDAAAVHAARERIEGLGFVLKRTITAGGTTIDVEER